MMGAELFDLVWVQAIVLFFSRFAWTLFAVGFLVSLCEFGVEFQSGRASFRDNAMNLGKGFVACSLFSTLPVAAYRWAVTTQGILALDIANAIQPGLPTTAGEIAQSAVNAINTPNSTNVFFALFALIMMGYCTVKIFFANLKRGGILLVQIAVGSLYMFSIPRGYIDGFMAWCKQIIGLCLTAFLQNTILVAGLLVFGDHMLLGLGLMLSASEIPRIAGQFGLETGTRTNMMSAVYATQQAVNITRTIASVAK
jgi:hypothetical protein